MPNPQEPGPEAEPAGDDPTAVVHTDPAEPETENLSRPSHAADPADAEEPGEQRRFTAPSGFDAGSTQIIDRAPEPATEIIEMNTGPIDPAATVRHAELTGSKGVGPQVIPARETVTTGVLRPSSQIRWGWVLAVALVIAALTAVAVLATVVLTRDSASNPSGEELVRTTIHDFDTAIQKGDLATLRSITCGSTADGYNKFDERQWADLHAKVAAAKQYPVVASIDEVVINGQHAEANVTSFMAFDPATRSTRSFDLEFRDEQWKICQAPGS